MKVYSILFQYPNPSCLARKLDIGLLLDSTSCALNVLLDRYGMKEHTVSFFLHAGTSARSSPRGQSSVNPSKRSPSMTSRKRTRRSVWLDLVVMCSHSYEFVCCSGTWSGPARGGRDWWNETRWFTDVRCVCATFCLNGQMMFYGTLYHTS